MGRAPCCDKANVKKGPWSPEEDAKLKAFIEQHGTGGNWIALPQKIGLKRCGKSCRLRWLNYLRPNIKHGGFSEEEDDIICSLYVSIGSRWSIIAAQLPGRTDNDIKNYWNTKLKKKLLGKQRKEQQAQARRVSSLIKQEIKRETTENLVVPAGVFSYNTSPYWTMPLPNNACIQDYDDLNNQHSYTDLVTATINSQCPCGISYPQEDQLYYPTTINMMLNPASSTCSSNIFQGLGNGNLANEMGVNPQQIDGSIYGMDQCMDMVNGSTNTSSTESTSTWGDINSLVYSPLISDYEATQQGMPPQDIAFEDSRRYFGIQMQ